MTMRWRRCVTAAGLALAASAGGLLVAGAADAQPAATASLSFSGDSGDFISQGTSWSYSTGNGDALNVTSSSGSLVSVSVNAYNGDWWTLDLDAPGTQVLTPGTYAQAHRYPFNGTGPGLDLSGEGRGCNELTGSFTVTTAVFGPDGYVQTFDATFEQHCEGGSPAARGELHISNPPAPPPPAPTDGGGHASNSAPPPGPAPQPTADQPTTADPGAAASTQPNPTNTAPPTTIAASPARDGGSALKGDARVPLLLLGVGAVFWVVFITAGAITVGLVMALRRR